MAEKPRGATQMEAPGMPAPLDPRISLEAELNEAVLRVSEYERALRSARALEREARKRLAALAR